MSSSFKDDNIKEKEKQSSLTQHLGRYKTNSYIKQDLSVVKKIVWSKFANDVSFEIDISFYIWRFD